MRRKVQGDVLVLERRGARQLLALAVDNHVAEQLAEGLGRPGKVGAVGVVHDDAAAVLGEHLARRAVEEDERRDPAHLELLAQLLLELPSAKGSASHGISL